MSSVCNRRFAGAGWRREAGSCPMRGGGHTIVSPATILGLLYHTDFRADDPFRVMNGPTNVQALYNYGLDASDALQAAVLNQPAYGAATFNGGPGITFDGTTDFLQSTFNTPIVSGKRPCVWCVFQRVSSATAKYVATLQNAGITTALAVRLGATNFEGEKQDAAFVRMDSGVAKDTSRHLMKLCFAVGGTGAMVLDGVTTNAANGNATNASLTLTTLGAITLLGVLTQPGNVVLARWIGASDAVTAQQDADMVTYLKGTNFPNYTGSSYGLP